MQKVTVETLLKSTKGLLLVNAIFWLSFGIASLVDAFGGAGTNGLRLLYGILMLINGGVMMWLGMKLEARNNPVFIVAILYTGLNAVLSITDQVGLIDLVILLLNISILGMLFILRERIKQAV